MAAKAQAIFINLHVESLDASIAFYSKIGFHQNKTFTDDTATMMALAPSASGVGTINVMLMTRARFQEFLPKDREPHSAKKSTEVILGLSANSKERVDEVAGKADEAGGKLDVVNLPEMPNMYGRSFEDLDGHIWEVMWMDESVTQGTAHAA